MQIPTLMNRSYSLFHLQEIDSKLDKARARIQEIDTLLADSAALNHAMNEHQSLDSIHTEKNLLLKAAEHEVHLQTKKIEQNQQKLYSGVVTNPKELEDLQLESTSLKKYLAVLEERLLEAMLETDQAKENLDEASIRLNETKQDRASKKKTWSDERADLNNEIATLEHKKKDYLEREEIPDLSLYQSLREKSGGIAVALMIDNSCGACGAPIPSAIAQAVKAPAKLAYCPTCKRILHPG